MDRSFHSPMQSPHSRSQMRSPFSGPKGRQSLSSKRPILPTSFRKSSRFSVSGKSIQSAQIIVKTPYHTVESFGTPLPVLVTEALTFVDSNTVVTAQISDCGYAWIVYGRHLLIWQYKQIGPQQQRNTSQCYELMLPQSDLVHRADLVCIIPSEVAYQSPNAANSPALACLAVSPEGVVRYWPSISHEGVSIEESIELNGQECDTVTYVPNVGCVLATTTCSVVLLSPNRRTIVSKTLKPPAGWLGGISKRISSLIFGPMSTTQSAETKLIKMSTSYEFGEWNIYVLAGHLLQKWSLDKSAKGNINGTEHLMYEFDVGRLAREAFHATLWDTLGVAASNDSDSEVWFLDMQVVTNPANNNTDLVLLAAGVNTQRSSQIHYATVCINCTGQQQPVNLQAFQILKVNTLYRAESERNDTLEYRLLLCSQSFYLYNQRSVISLGPLFQRQPPISTEEPDIIEFTHEGDRILGGSICINTPLFFSKNHGLITLIGLNDFNNTHQDLNNSSIMASDGLVSHNDSMSYSYAASESNIGTLTVYDLDPHEISVTHTNSVGQLKAAFLFYIKKHSMACDQILDQIFPITGSDEVNAPLDKTVLAVCRELVNDVPDGDPRWNDHYKSNRVSLGSSSSMQIQKQLQDKQKALELFITFLKNCNLWVRLSKVSIGGIVTATSYVIAEYAEKIVAAITLWNFQEEHNNLLKQAMNDAINKAITDDEDDDEFLHVNKQSSGNLTIQDLFYRHITQVHRIIQQLAKVATEQSHSDLPPLQLAYLIQEINVIILGVLHEVISYRHKKVETFASLKSASEYLPWTAAVGDRGVREALYTMQKLTMHNGVLIITADVNFMNNLYEQLISIIDIILDGKKSHLESVRGTQKFNALLQEYETERHNLIKPIYENRQYERASVLAEKYCDFAILVMICDTTNNQTKLDEYMTRFASHQFSEYVFNWYLRENKPSRLIIQHKENKSQNKALSSLVSDYPSLSWLQKIFQYEYLEASSVLYNLAKQETEYVTRKKSMLSIAKLAHLADLSSYQTESNKKYLNDINNELTLIAHQEGMPDIVMSEHGYDVENPRVLIPSELIRLYIDLEANSIITEFEFKKALDLLDYVDDELEKSELQHQIWCASILKDQILWQKLSINPNVEGAMETMFFKIVDLALFMGGDLDEFMPPLDRILEASELIPLNQDPNFQYLMKSGYEHTYRTYKSVDSESGS